MVSGVTSALDGTSSSDSAAGVLWSISCKRRSMTVSAGKVSASRRPYFSSNLCLNDTFSAPGNVNGERARTLGGCKDPLCAGALARVAKRFRADEAHRTRRAPHQICELRSPPSPLAPVASRFSCCDEAPVSQHNLDPLMRLVAVPSCRRKARFVATFKAGLMCGAVTTHQVSNTEDAAACPRTRSAKEDTQTFSVETEVMSSPRRVLA